MKTAASRCTTKETGTLNTPYTSCQSILYYKREHTRVGQLRHNEGRGNVPVSVTSVSSDVNDCIESPDLWGQSNQCVNEKHFYTIQEHWFN